jgi:hypothetical protein
MRHRRGTIGDPARHNAGAITLGRVRCAGILAAGLGDESADPEISRGAHPHASVQCSGA